VPVADQAPRHQESTSARNHRSASGIDDDEFDLDAPDETEFGANLGFGVMTFAGQWGLRGDIRYFREIGGDVSAAAPGSSALEDFDFWRGTSAPRIAGERDRR
jgi:hypothetical protein